MQIIQHLKPFVCLLFLPFPTHAMVTDSFSSSLHSYFECHLFAKNKKAEFDKPYYFLLLFFKSK